MKPAIDVTALLLSLAAAALVVAAAWTFVHRVLP